MFQKRFREAFAGQTRSIGKWFGKVASPNTYTALVLLFGIAGGVLLAFHYLVTAILCILLSGLFDAVDGAVAKVKKKTSIFGGIFDSVTDRITETAFYIGFFFGWPELQAASLMAVASFLLSGYAFERIDKEGKAPKGFILLERKERMLLIVVAIVFLPIELMVAQAVLIIISVWSFYSIFQMLYSAKQLFK